MAAFFEHCHYHHAAEDPALCPTSLKMTSVGHCPSHLCSPFPFTLPGIRRAEVTPTVSSLYLFSLCHEDPVNPEKNNLVIFQGLRPLAFSPCISLLSKKPSRPLSSSSLLSLPTFSEKFCFFPSLPWSWASSHWICIFYCSFFIRVSILPIGLAFLLLDHRPCLESESSKGILPWRHWDVSIHGFMPNLQYSLKKRIFCFTKFSEFTFFSSCATHNAN